MRGVWIRLGARPASLSILVVSAWLTLVASLAALIRVLPWFFDAQIPRDVALAFGTSLALVAAETVLVVAIPCGVALACESLVDRGALRALTLVGITPSRIARWFVAPAVGFALVLSIVSWNVAAQAEAPGRLVKRLVEGGLRACERESRPSTTFVPFVRATWMCSPDHPARLFVQTPARFGSTFVTGTKLSMTDDLTGLEVDDARLSLKDAEVHVGKLSLRRIPPLFASATLSELARALLLAVGVIAVAAGTAWGILGAKVPRTGRVFALGAALSGSGAVLGCLRLNERSVALTSVPALAIALILSGALLPVAVCYMRVMHARATTR